MINIITLLMLLHPVHIEKFNAVHPVHLSVSNFEYIENEAIFSLSVRVFTDDFQAVIKKEQGSDIIIKEKNTDDTRKQIDDYIHKHIKLCFNNKNIFQNIRSDKIIINPTENTTEVFYRFKQKIPKKLSVENTLFSGFFRDQKNLFIFTCENTREAFKFDENNTKKEFSLK